MNDYTISVIENIDQFNKIYTKFYEQSLGIDAIIGIHLIGLDCEYISRSSYPESYDKADWCINKGDGMPIICKLQIATQNISIIIDLCKIGKFLPDNLINILKSESWLKFGAGITCDMDHLSYQYNLGNCNGVINASILCRYFGSLNPKLENLYNILSKTKEPFKKLEVKGRDWSREMTVSQIKYASEDACASYIIGVELMNHMRNSLNMLFTKFDNNNQEDQNIQNNNTIEVKVSNENYVGILMDYVQRNKLKPPSFDYSMNIDNSKNIKTFYCTCTIEHFEKKYVKKSDGFTNKKDSKQNSSKQILDLIQNLSKN